MDTRIRPSYRYRIFHDDQLTKTIIKFKRPGFVKQKRLIRPTASTVKTVRVVPSNKFVIDQKHRLIRCHPSLGKLVERFRIDENYLNNTLRFVIFYQGKFKAIEVIKE